MLFNPVEIVLLATGSYGGRLLFVYPFLVYMPPSERGVPFVLLCLEVFQNYSLGPPFSGGPLPCIGAFQEHPFCRANLFDFALLLFGRAPL
jgi:hypothetical protein